MSALDRLEAALAAHGCDPKRRGDHLDAKCPAHDDQIASLTADQRTDKVLVRCHAGAGCAPEEIVAALDRTMADLFDEPISTSKIEITSTYDYVDEAGKLSYQVCRLVPKSFRQRRPDGHGGWVWNMQGVERVPYRLPELIAGVAAGRWIVVAEGERDCDRLVSEEFCATTNAGGAGKWSAAWARYFKAAKVAIIVDNDEPGRQHAEQVARSLVDIAAEVKVIELPDLAEHGDVSTWLDAGGTAEGLRRIITDAPEWIVTEAPAPLSPLSINGTGPAKVPDLAPTEMIEIAGDRLLDAVERYLSRFVAYPSEHARIAHVLWIAHAHRMDAWESTPRIAFLSPEPNSGKTRALEVTEPLVPRPIHAVNTTPAYLFRKVSDEAGTPTILYDEIDTLFGPRAKDNEDIRGMLNAGHRKGAMAGRCVVRGKVVETEELPAYCAVALAGLDDLPDTLMSRSVIVRMRRRAPDEIVEPFRPRLNAPEGEALRDQLARWAMTIPADIWPDMPDGIEDRNADIWEALLAVADAAGGDWPERARVTAVTLVTDSKAGVPSMGVRLLADIRTIFGDEDYLFTEDLIAGLVAVDEAPWADLRGRPIDARGLARRLAKYEVKPGSVRVGDRTGKGYARHDLADPWSRYVTSVTVPLTNSSRGYMSELVGNDANGLDTPVKESVTSVTTSQPIDAYDCEQSPEVVSETVDDETWDDDAPADELDRFDDSTTEVEPDGPCPICGAPPPRRGRSAGSAAPIKSQTRR